MSNPKHNLKALLVGTGEFRFCPGATSASDAKLKGFRDVGNIVAFTPETEVGMEAHEGSYRGRKVVDKKYSTRQQLEYVLTADEWKRSNLRFLFMAEDGTGHTQSVKTVADADAMAFTAQLPSATDRLYDIYEDGGRVRKLTFVAFATGAVVSVSVTADDTTDTIEKVGHGLLDGQAVIIGGDVVPGGLSAGTIYYVVNKTTDDFQLAATAGGTPINITSTGTNPTYRPVLSESDYEADTTLGAVRFLSVKTATITPVISCAAIVAGDADYFYGITPLEEPVQEGYGRLTIFDEEDDNEVVLDHVDFSCIVAGENANSVDGKKTTEFILRVTITADAGNLLVRDGNDEPA
jgi:hypothetical protein